MSTKVPAQFAGHYQELFYLFGADMNSTADQLFSVVGGSTPTPYYQIHLIRATNASTSLTTAAGGIYSAASKGGSAYVASGQAYSTLTGSTLGLDLTVAAVGKGSLQGIPYFSLTTGQGSAATADIRIFGAWVSR